VAVPERFDWVLYVNVTDAAVVTDNLGIGSLISPFLIVSVNDSITISEIVTIFSSRLYVRQSGSWAGATAYCKNENTWKASDVYIKVDNVWTKISNA
jgi:hypothetical protein